MITYIKGNILQRQNGLIIHGTNCSGGFGSGVAGAIRAMYPQVYEEFATLEPSASLLGTFKPVKLNDDFVIGNCFTQHKFGSDGKVYASPLAILTSVTSAYEYADENYMYTVSLPKIGSGLGGLSWEDDV